MIRRTQNRAMAAICALILAFGIFPAYAKEGGGKEGKEGPVYVDFKNIVVPVIKKNGRTGMVALTVMAEVKDEKAQSKVADHMPRLRDAFIRVLYGSMDNKQFLKEDGNLNIDNIKARLLKTAQIVMKDDDQPIKDILFQQIAQQTY